VTFANDWSVLSNPADHSKFKDQPSFVRKLRTDIEERLAAIIYGFTSGENTAPGFKQLLMLNQGSDPSAPSDAYILYAKDSAAVSELHGRHEVAGVKQLTLDGLLNLANTKIASEAAGDILIRGASGWIRLAKGLDDKILRLVSGYPAWDDEQEMVVPVFENEYLHVRDEKAANTDGGTFTSGAWRTRVLNTEKTNIISGASLASNQITLPAGTYQVKGWAKCYGVNIHKARLRDTTGSADLIISDAGYCGYGGADHIRTDEAVLNGRFTLSVQSVIELQHWCTNTQSNTGLGLPANIDSKVEVYAELEIWKTA